MDDIPLDRTKPRPAGVVRATQALRGAIAALWEETVTLDGGPDHEPVREAVRRVVRQALADGLRADQLVVVFRAVWDDLPRGASPLERVRAHVMVSALIAAFYQEAETPPDDPAGR